MRNKILPVVIFVTLLGCKAETSDVVSSERPSSSFGVKSYGGDFSEQGKVVLDLILQKKFLGACDRLDALYDGDPDKRALQVLYLASILDAEKSYANGNSRSEIKLGYETQKWIDHFSKLVTVCSETDAGRLEFLSRTLFEILEGKMDKCGLMASDDVLYTIPLRFQERRSKALPKEAQGLLDKGMWWMNHNFGVKQFSFDYRCESAKDDPFNEDHLRSMLDVYNGRFDWLVRFGAMEQNNSIEWANLRLKEMKKEALKYHWAAGRELAEAGIFLAEKCGVSPDDFPAVKRIKSKFLSTGKYASFIGLELLIWAREPGSSNSRLITALGRVFEEALGNPNPIFADRALIAARVLYCADHGSNDSLIPYSFPDEKTSISIVRPLVYIEEGRKGMGWSREARNSPTFPILEGRLKRLVSMRPAAAKDLGFTDIVSPSGDKVETSDAPSPVVFAGYESSTNLKHLFEQILSAEKASDARTARGLTLSLIPKENDVVRLLKPSISQEIRDRVLESVRSKEFAIAPSIHLAGQLTGEKSGRVEVALMSEPEGYTSEPRISDIFIPGQRFRRVLFYAKEAEQAASFIQPSADCNYLWWNGEKWVMFDGIERYVKK